MKKEEETVPLNAGANARIFRLAKQLRRNMTPEEEKLWNFLKERPSGYKFRRQHPFYRYILDFYCHQLKLVIEVDGVSHDRKTQKEWDVLRTETILEFGLQEIRFTNEEVNDHFEDVKERIQKLLYEAERC